MIDWLWLKYLIVSIFKSWNEDQVFNVKQNMKHKQKLVAFALLFQAKKLEWNEQRPTFLQTVHNVMGSWLALALPIHSQFWHVNKNPDDLL